MLYYTPNLKVYTYNTISSRRTKHKLLQKYDKALHIHSMHYAVSFVIQRHFQASSQGVVNPITNRIKN